MKNLLKFGFFALAISLSVVACNSNKATTATDSTTVSDSTMTTDSASMDSTKVDTTAAPAADTTAKM